MRVAGTTVTQERLEAIFAELRAHHWLGIPQTYRPLLRKFHTTQGTVGTYESVTYDLMADGSLPRWFKERFIWPRADGLESQI